MPTLNLQQSELGGDRYRITVYSDLPGLTLQHTVDFDYRLSDADRELIRWYLEDYLDKPFDPNPSIAARAEARMAEIGRALFEDPDSDTNSDYISGARIGELLVKTRTPCWCSTPAARPMPRPRRTRAKTRRLTMRPTRPPIKEVPPRRAPSPPSAPWPRRSWTPAWPGWWPCAKTCGWSPPPASSTSCTATWSEA